MPIFLKVQFGTQCLLLCRKVVCFGIGRKSALIDRNELDIGALVATDESTTISKIEE